MLHRRSGSASIQPMKQLTSHSTISPPDHEHGERRRGMVHPALRFICRRGRAGPLLRCISITGPTTQAFPQERFDDARVVGGHACFPTGRHILRLSALARYR
jgi:hypothetical protein